MSEDVIQEYGHGHELVRERVDGDQDKYHYHGPFGRIKSFRDPTKARLYADVQTVTGGFREEKTGERGVPPAVARARQDVLIGYLVSNPTMGVKWVARFYGLQEDVIRDYVEMVRDRAEEKREAGDA